ncbi:MAG: hypothetical protein J5877_01165 [Clostridia bacterium]|nr:hypothetical protein [Clostridia bacterium]
MAKSTFAKLTTQIYSSIIEEEIPKEVITLKKIIIIVTSVIVAAAIAVTCYFRFFRVKKIKPEDLTTTESTRVAEQFESVTNADKKSDEKSIVGLWAGTTDDEFYYLFNEDKTGSYTMGVDIQEFTYKIDGDTVIIVFKGNTKEHVYKYSIENNVLSIENDYGIVEKYNWK